jgi:hypothetical protein
MTSPESIRRDRRGMWSSLVEGGGGGGGESNGWWR